MSRKKWWHRNAGELLAVIVGAVIGSILTGVTTVSILVYQEHRATARQEGSLAQERLLDLKAARRPVYLDYLSKAGAWVVAQKTRAKECQPGTDKPLAPSEICSVGYFSGLQQARYELRVAENEMSLVESPTMGSLRGLFSRMFPTAEARDEGPFEGKPSDEFAQFYVIMLDYAACDTNPDPDIKKCKNVDAEIHEAFESAGISLN